MENHVPTAPLPDLVENAEALLTPGEVARLFRVDPKTVTRWEKDGRLASVKTLGGHRRYPQTQINALLTAPGPGDGAVLLALEEVRDLATAHGDPTAAARISDLITTLRTQENKH
jgi:excisionase family DNA binding protein